MTRLTLETIGRAGFGYRFASFDRDRPHPFVTAMTRRCATPTSRLFCRRAPLRRVVASSAAQYVRLATRPTCSAGCCARPTPRPGTG